jgi:hypothetical protein
MHAYSILSILKREVNQMRHPAKCLVPVFAACTLFAGETAADSIPVEMLDPNLQVTTVLTRIGTHGVVLWPGRLPGSRRPDRLRQWRPLPRVLDSLNSNSERGLLSLVLHPNFPTTPHVYVRWTESSTGADTNVNTASQPRD